MQISELHSLVKVYLSKTIESHKRYVKKTGKMATLFASLK